MSQLLTTQGLATSKKPQYDEIELTPEEEQEALRLMRKEKHRRQKEEEYKKRLRTLPQPVKMDAAEYKAWVLSQYPDINPDLQKSQFELLVNHFTGNEERGLLLFGGVGCGKTTLMRIFQANPKASFAVHPCARFAEMFAAKEGGYEAIKRYYGNGTGMRNYFNQEVYGICFDDLGEETSKKHFGNETNVMETILLARYDRPETWKYTHITTNLTVDQIEEIYGARVRSRMREMFIPVEFKGVNDLRTPKNPAA